MQLIRLRCSAWELSGADDDASREIWLGKGRDLEFLDASVTGGRIQAEEGQLTFLIGGDDGGLKRGAGATTCNPYNAEFAAGKRSFAAKSPEYAGLEVLMVLG